MANKFEETQKLVSETLSELVESIANNLSSSDIHDLDGCNIYDDVQSTVKDLLEQVEKKDTATSHVTTEKVGLKNLSKSTIIPSDFKSLSYLGISQTGRVMDPICLQQTIFSSIAAENLVEYQWPPNSSGDYYMLQEQVSTFLNITSFKRKYPGIERRKLDADEVNHLLSNHVISEVQVTLGLVALRSADVCDLMMKEYPEKYVEYNHVMQEREKQKRRNKYKQYASSANQPGEKSQITNHLKRSMRQAAAYNAHINRQRKEDFSVYYDMSTNVLQYPKKKVRKLDPSLTRPSLYPCALIPGQFQEYYHRYTKSELMYLPLNTSLYGPPQPPIDTSVGKEYDSDSDSVADSGGSVSSVSRSVKSATSNKTKTKQAENLPDVVDAAPDEKNSQLKTNDENPPQEEDEVPNTEPEKPECGICHNDETANKKGEPERLIKCSQCDNRGHPSCLEMSDELVTVIETYNWQCMECKTCTICSMPHREDRMMFCDRCDRGYHTFCVSLRAIPSGVWACSRCIYADPEFVKRKRKQLRASMSPGSRGRGRGRRQARRIEPQTPPVAVGVLEQIRSASVDEKDEEPSMSDRSTQPDSDAEATPHEEKPPIVTIKIALPVTSENQ